MKTTVLIVSILISTLFSNVLFAQDKIDFKIAYGTTFLYDKEFGHADKSYGTLSAGIDLKVNKRVSVGLQLNNMLGSREIKTEDCYDWYCNTTIELEKPKFHSHLFFKVSYNWLIKPNVQLYSSALVSTPIELFDDFFVPLPHITFIGCRYGNKHAVFGELGYGASQIVSVGYLYRI